MTTADFPTRIAVRRGFTLTEVLVAVAIIAILAMMAVPSMQERIVREQVVEAAKLADIVKEPIATHWHAHAEMPVDNAEADVPEAEKIVGNFVTAVTVEDGAVHITFGNNANAAIRGRTLTMRPAVVADTPRVPPTWVCAASTAPPQMTVQGRDRTDLESRFLPVNCRQTAK